MSESIHNEIVGLIVMLLHALYEEEGVTRGEREEYEGGDEAAAA